MRITTKVNGGRVIMWKHEAKKIIITVASICPIAAHKKDGNLKIDEFRKAAAKMFDIPHHSCNFEIYL